jgi:hypothetical protein
MASDSLSSDSWPDPEIPSVDSAGHMRPPFAKYPNLRRASSGWRMGQGESYIEEFGVWWSRQPRHVRLAVRQAYPEPEEWSGFWASRFGA